MRAIHMTEKGGPKVLRLVEIPTPEPGPGQVLIKVDAAAVNFADVMRRRGDAYPIPTPSPFVLGAQVAGTVAALGEGVEHLTARCGRLRHRRSRRVGWLRGIRHRLRLQRHPHSRWFRHRRRRRYRRCRPHCHHGPGRGGQSQAKGTASSFRRPQAVWVPTRCRSPSCLVRVTSSPLPARQPNAKSHSNSAPTTRSTTPWTAGHRWSVSSPVGG